MIDWRLAFLWFLEGAMSTAATTRPLPAIPPEVTAFAAEQGVNAYLLPVVELARRIFPTAPLTVLLEDDPETSRSHSGLEVKDCPVLS